MNALTQSADLALTTTNNKLLGTLLARLALAGHTVHKGQHGDFTVCKFGLTHYCADYSELAAFATKVGAAS